MTVDESTLEAVSFAGTDRPWHAVNPGTDRTFCGLNTLRAKRMWEHWTEHPHFRCGRCARAITATQEIAAQEAAR